LIAQAAAHVARQTGLGEDPIRHHTFDMQATPHRDDCGRRCVAVER